MRRHRHFFEPVMNDLLYLMRRGQGNVRAEWIWVTWNRKYYDKNSICMELLPDEVVKKIARGVHDNPLWLPHHVECFHRIKTDVHCTLVPWMPTQSKVIQTELLVPTLLLCKYL